MELQSIPGFKDLSENRQFLLRRFVSSLPLKLVKIETNELSPGHVAGRAYFEPAYIVTWEDSKTNPPELRNRRHFESIFTPDGTDILHELRVKNRAVETPSGVMPGPLIMVSTIIQHMRDDYDKRFPKEPIVAWSIGDPENGYEFSMIKPDPNLPSIYYEEWTLRELIAHLNKIDQPLKRVWLDVKTGEFSESWIKDSTGDNWINEELEKPETEIPEGLKLIEFRGINDPAFVFTRHMKLR